MKSERLGRSISVVEVANVTAQGFWLLLKGTEHFVPFDQFPWFRDASIGQLVNVQLPSAHHLHWPELDLDLSVESLSHPERYPLVSSSSGKTSTKQNGGAVGKNLTTKARPRKIGKK